MKPRSKRAANGLVQLNIECYGGGLWYTWFDRDLSISGRVIIRKKNINGEFEKYQHSLIHITKSVVRVPSLCIHLRTQEEREAFKINKEDHLMPILCEEIDRTLSAKPQPVPSSPTTDILPTGVNDTIVQLQPNTSIGMNTNIPVGEKDLWVEEQPTELLKLLAAELQCACEDIADFELSLYDTQKAAVTGAREEFLCSSRIDNLASCFVATEALVAQAADPSLLQDEDVSLVALFDHEEVGSESAVGAGSPIMSEAVSRITEAMSSSSVTQTSLNELNRMALQR